MSALRKLKLVFVLSLNRAHLINRQSSGLVPNKITTLRDGLGLKFYKNYIKFYM